MTKAPNYIQHLLILNIFETNHWMMLFTFSCFNKGTRLCSRPFTYVTSFASHNKQMEKDIKTKSLHFSRWRNWASKSLSDLPKVTQLIRAGPELRSGSKALSAIPCSRMHPYWKSRGRRESVFREIMIETKYLPWKVSNEDGGWRDRSGLDCEGPWKSPKEFVLYHSQWGAAANIVAGVGC